MAKKKPPTSSDLESWVNYAAVCESKASDPAAYAFLEWEREYVADVRTLSERLLSAIAEIRRLRGEG